MKKRKPSTSETIESIAARLPNFSVLDDSTPTPFDGPMIVPAAPSRARTNNLAKQQDAAGIPDVSTGNTTEDAWQGLTSALATCLGQLDEDDALIISSQVSSAFIQFADQGAYGMRAEAVANEYLPPSEQLSVEREKALVSLGWSAPTYVQSEGSGEPPEGSANFFVDAALPVPYEALGVLATASLRQVYGVEHPGQLQYKAYNFADGSQIRFSSLKLKREPVQRAADNATSSVVSSAEPPTLAPSASRPQQAIPATYPKPNRSSYRPNSVKSDDDPHLDIGWNEGFMSDGRPYRVEAWCEDQITSLSFFFSTAGIENFSNVEFAHLLEHEGFIHYLGNGHYRSAAAMPFTDDSGNSMWSVSVVIDDEDGVVTDSSVTLLPYAGE